MAFSATRAALEGFRVVGRRPISVLVWAIYWAVIGVALMVAACYMLGPTIVGDIIAHHNDRQWMHDYVIDNEAAFWNSFGGVIQYIGVLAAVLLLALIVQMCAVFRAVLRPNDRGLAYLRFGGDELRQIGLLVLVMLFYGVLSFIVSFAMVFGLRELDLDHHLSVLIGAVGGLVCAVVFIWLGVRLSLAQAMTFAQRRIRFFGSWGLTKGHFWGLFGAFLLAFIFSCIVSYLGDVVAQFVGGMLGFDLSSVFSGERFGDFIDHLSPAELATAFGAGGAAYIVISHIASAFQMAVAYAPQAAAYRDLMEERNPPAPEPVAAPPPEDHGHGGHGQAGDHSHGESHGAEAAALAAGAAIAAGAAAFAAEADAHGHGHGEGHGDAHGHGDGHGDAHGDAHGDGHGEAHAAPAADAHGAHPDPHHAEPAPHAEPAADHGHGDHGHADHGHAVGHADPAHGEPAHAEPASDHADHGHADHAHADHGADHGHAEPHPEAHAEPAHAEPGHGDPHAGAHSEPAHAEPGHGDAGHGEAAGHDDHHPEAHPAAPHDDAHPTDPHGH